MKSLPNLLKSLFHKKEEASVLVSNQKLLEQMEIIRVVSSNITSALSIDEVLQSSVDLINDKLGYFGAVLYLVEKNTNLLRSKTVSRTWYTDLALKFIKSPFDKLFVPLDPVSRNLTAQTVLQKKIFLSHSLSDFIVPAVTEPVANLLQKVTGHKSGITIPMVYKDECIGAIMFTRNIEYDFQQDLPILNAFADQVAIVISNSQLFKKHQEQIYLLTSKNHDIQSLFYLTSRISQTLDPLKVAQNAVDSLPQNENMIGAILSLYDDTTSIIRVTAITTNEFSHQASNIVGDFTKFKIHINDPQAQNNPTVLTIKKGQPHYSDSLGPALSPPLPAKLVPVLEKFLKVSSTVDYPIFSRGKVVGTVSFLLRGKKFSELDENQRQLLNTYTTQIGIALENALLFTRAQEIQRNLQDALDQLNEARRRERDMIDVMGHELRTPISIVRNALAVLDADFKKTGSIARDRLAKYLDIGLESVRREITLIETLLSATKVDSHKIQLTLTKVDMADVVRDALEAEQYRATGKGIKIILNEPRKPLWAFADRIRSQEIVDNLLSNAIKYTEKGTITINMSMEGDNAYLEVVDTGIGISPEDIAHLGKKFFRAKQFQSEYGLRPSGTGLGLFVAFELVRIMGGKKVIKSTPGQGSTFAFYLPLYQGQADKHVEEGFMPG